MEPPPDDDTAAPLAPRTRRLPLLLGLAVLAVVVLVVLVTRGGGDPAARSAALGPDGTRTIEGVPDELPARLVVDDAEGVQGTLARAGEDWSAALGYSTAQGRSELEAHVLEVARDDGYELERALEDARSRVLQLRGPDGSTLTVNLVGPPGGPIEVWAVRVGP